MVVRLIFPRTVIVVGGAMCDRAWTRPLAERMFRQFTVFNYDRRGRGDSGDTNPYTVDREVEDLAAVIEQAGGTPRRYTDTRRARH